MSVANIDNVFQALAHPIRRQIIDFVAQNPGMSNSKICENFNISRIAISKHIKILADAELLIIEVVGRYRLHYFNVLPMQLIYERWTDEYSRFFAQKIHKFKLEIEEQNNSGDSDEKTA
jgi:DNA-binding transcriptional ArsR family regulator